jgi:hypothetical protein
LLTVTLTVNDWPICDAGNSAELGLNVTVGVVAKHSVITRELMQAQSNAATVSLLTLFIITTLLSDNLQF